MTWAELTTPPAPRPPAPTHPLFTTKFFSTTSFGPGHLVGAGLLVFGIGAIVKVALGGSRDRQAAPGRAVVQNPRGQYGRTP